ncbi:MAG: LLM class flavin-dependent oxidoreductase [Thermomicrobiales bacterium]|nr:LLM class flavin-dependent oxidoreductase [Thermomicrobiales bacterium]
MTNVGRVGFAFTPASSAQAVQLIGRAEDAGVESVWMVMSALAIDTLTLYGAAAVRTDRIRLGTSIVPAFTRHPLAMATQAMALEELAPQRLRLGIGSAHARTMEDVYHLDFRYPLTRLREYLEILRPVLQTGEAHFHGEYYSADAKIAHPTGTPVLISALRAPAFELAGELTDGGISWLCPPDYLRRVAKPALARGAERADRLTPPLIAHVPVMVADDRALAYERARELLAYYAAAPFYARMFADAGHPLHGGAISDGLLDSLLVVGTPDTIEAALQERLDNGMDEIAVSLLPLADQHAEEGALLTLLAELSRR